MKKPIGANLLGAEANVLPHYYHYDYHSKTEKKTFKCKSCMK